MSAADYLDEWFEIDRAEGAPSRRAASSARCSGRARRARRTCCCITTWARSTAPSARGASRRAATDPSAQRIAAAARAHGAEIRTEAAVSRSARVKGGRATRRRARERRRAPRQHRRVGRSIRGARSSSSSSEKNLPDDFVDRDRALQVPRLVGKGEPRARRSCRDFTCLPRRRVRTCAAPSRSARASTISSAPTTTRSTASSRSDPYMDIVIPSMIDPGDGAAGQARDVRSSCSTRRTT